MQRDPRARRRVRLSHHRGCLARDRRHATRDSRIGDCRYSDIAVFSFHPVKIITTAEGGMVTTHDAALADACSLLRSHGMTREPARCSDADAGAVVLRAAVARLQLPHDRLAGGAGLAQLDASGRNGSRDARRWRTLRPACADLPLILPVRPTDRDSALHLYVVEIDAARTGSAASGVRAPAGAGIGVNVHYIPVHCSRTSAARISARRVPGSEAYYSRVLSCRCSRLIDQMTDADAAEAVIPHCRA